MKPSKDRDKALKSRLLFIAALWMAISVALLSALAPLGPPSSRLTGSAFNPATTSVVLKARSPSTAPAVRVTEPDGGGQGPSLAPTAIGLLNLTLLLSAVWLLLPVGPLGWRSSPPAALARFSRPRTRAPPALF